MPRKIVLYAVYSCTGSGSLQVQAELVSCACVGGLYYAGLHLISFEIFLLVYQTTPPCFIKLMTNEKGTRHIQEPDDLIEHRVKGEVESLMASKY